MAAFRDLHVKRNVFDVSGGLETSLSLSKRIDEKNTFEFANYHFNINLKCSS